MDKRVSLYILWTVALTIASCRDKEVKEVVKSQEYSFEVKTWGMPGSKSFEAFLYNTDLQTYPPNRRGGIQFKRNTLYILRHEHLNKEWVSDTLTIDLTGDQVDSLYNLTYRYLADFEIDNEIEVNKVYEIIHDGSNISVSLNYNGKIMECVQHRLKGISNASVGADRLIDFINKKASEEFRLY